jgi:hypothetical protein
MKFTTLAGVVLVIMGLVALAYGGISYTKKETIIDVGPIEATAETHERIPLPPIVGGAALAAGVALLVAGARRSAS